MNESEGGKKTMNRRTLAIIFVLGITVSAITVRAWKVDQDAVLVVVRYAQSQGADVSTFVLKEKYYTFIFVHVWLVRGPNSPYGGSGDVAWVESYVNLITGDVFQPRIIILV